jgi:hypothetical protein
MLDVMFHNLWVSVRNLLMGRHVPQRVLPQLVSLSTAVHLLQSLTELKMLVYN